MHPRLGWLWIAAAGCANSGAGEHAFTDGPDATTSDAGSTSATDAPTLEGDGNADDAVATCQAPDMLIVLDRTLSMAREPNGAAPPNNAAGHALSKWFLATNVVTATTAAPSDTTIRFGLELFPLDPQETTDAGATGHCVTLTQTLAGVATTNTSCTPGEVHVVPALGTGARIATALDPETRHLCVSTPIASALDTASALLKSLAEPSRKQFVLLVTDGGETCRGTAAVGIAQQLAAAGVLTYVVGFGASDAGAGGVNRPLLNDLACAGKTATSFATACKLADGGAGYVAVAPNGAEQFFTAENGSALAVALKTIEGQVCCGCTR
jgi:hypothetical protein